MKTDDSPAPPPPASTDRHPLRLTALLAALLAATAVFLFYLLPQAVQRLLNRVHPEPSPPGTAVSPPPAIPVVDLHADPLLWRRDLLRRHSHGHIDLPRLRQGNVALQLFAAAAKIPLGINFERNSAHSPDLLTLLAFGQRWPPRTWASLLQRALYMAERLHQFAARANGRLLVIQSADDLEQLLSQRRAGADTVGALLALEGVHALEGELDNLDQLYDAGYRVLGLTHFFDNEAGGSAHGERQGGLTPFGHDLLQRAEAQGMIIDLAHAAPRLIDDVLAAAASPVINSHTGLRDLCDSPRNISDHHARGIAGGGGLIGIAFFPETVCGRSISDIVRTIRYGADLVGVDHVAIGTDFDGAVSTPIDSSGFDQITAALLAAGFTQEETTRIMSGNALRFLQNHLPES